MGVEKDVFSQSIAARTSRGLTNGGGPRGRRQARPGGGGQDDGLTNGSGRTNGSGLTNGSGRTNGSGLTNGSGRTNGSGFTNGSGRTNGSRLRSGSSLPFADRRARRRRRQVASVGVLALFLTLVSVGALGLGGDNWVGARVDGRFDDWVGHTASVPRSNAAGLEAVGFQPLKGGAGLFLQFGAALEGRADVLVLLDEDGSASTGYFDGCLGAEGAVRVVTDGGRVVSSARYAFGGADRLDASMLAVTGGAQAALSGASVELLLPFAPSVFSVALVTGDASRSSGALTRDGVAAPCVPPAPALSQKVRNGIRIDGDLTDWSSIAKVQDPSDEALPARLDMLEAAAVGDSGSAEFYVLARGGALEGTLPFRAEPLRGGDAAGGSVPTPARRVSGGDLLEVYLDTDLNADTGARVGDIGAERLLRVEGAGGVPLMTEFLALRDGAWKATGELAEAAASGHALEVAVESAGLVGARARFSLTGFEGATDVNDLPVVVGRFAGALAQPPETPAPVPVSRGGALSSPIPELSDVAAVSGAVGLVGLFMGRRRRRAADGQPVL